LEPELASFDAGSINLGKGVFSNPQDFLDKAAKRMKEKGVKPEIEIFDSGMIVTALRMQQKGKLDEPLHFQFVLGTPWGAPATHKFFLHLYEHIPKKIDLVYHWDRQESFADVHDRPDPGGPCQGRNGR
jgi:3-keto-5-aminohexanoate cleavage enzyme